MRAETWCLFLNGPGLAALGSVPDPGMGKLRLEWGRAAGRMQHKGNSGPEAVVLDPDAGLRRDIEIFLVRHYGIDVAERALVRGFDPQPGAAPKLVVTSGFAEEDGAGLRLIRLIRERGLETFVLYLDRNGHPDEAGDAFAAGADDVIRLPFTMREFGLRLRKRDGRGTRLALTARGASQPVPLVMLDGENRLMAAGTSAHASLTRAEAEVMTVLIRRGGALVTRDELSQAIDNCEWSYGDRKFDVHVTNIRKKLKRAFGGRYVVRTIRAEGYAFCELPDAAPAASAPRDSNPKG